MDKNLTVAYVQPQFATLALLEPENASADWSDETEHIIKVRWDWKENDASHNYVWDERARMMVEVKLFNRDDQLIDSILTTLNDAQLHAREAELVLNRSCATYQMRLIIDDSLSPIGKGEGDIFVTIGTGVDLADFINRVNNGETGLNAVMTDDVSMNWRVSYGENGPYVGPEQCVTLPVYADLSLTEHVHVWRIDIDIAVI